MNYLSRQIRSWCSPLVRAHPPVPSPHEFRFDFAQKVGSWPLFRASFAVFALKNQFVFSVSKS
jgi:hypothetical protein